MPETTTFLYRGIIERLQIIQLIAKLLSDKPMNAMKCPCLNSLKCALIAGYASVPGFCKMISYMYP